MKHLLTLFVVGTLLLCANAQSKQTFRFAHGIPDAGPVDVRVEGKIIFNDVKFGTVTHSVFISSSEALNVTITTAVKKTTLLTDLFTFTQPLTVAAVGTLSSEALLIGYLDFPNVTPEKKSSAVRAINLIVNSPELAVRSTKVIGGSNNLLAETVPFVAATDYEIVPATIYNLLIATAEGNNNLIYKPGVTFAPLNYYTIFLFGDYTSGSASKTAEDAARQGNFAPVGAAKNLFLNIVNDAKQLLPVETYDEL